MLAAPTPPFGQDLPNTGFNANMSAIDIEPVGTRSYIGEYSGVPFELPNRPFNARMSLTFTEPVITKSGGHARCDAESGHGSRGSALTYISSESLNPSSSASGTDGSGSQASPTPSSS
jgi:hypothetical protein